jgi:hypothetical protein
MSNINDTKLIKQQIEEAKKNYVNPPVAVVTSPGGKQGEMVTVNLSNSVSKTVKVANNHSPGTALVLSDTMDINAQLLGDSTVPEVSAHSITRRHYRLKQYEDDVLLGQIKILIEVEVTNTQLEYWVGGHVKKPILIKKFPPNVILEQYRLDNVGKGKQDWVFSYRYSVIEDTAIVGVIYGNKSQSNWELEDKRAKNLFASGNGFWFSSARFVSTAYKNFSDTIDEGIPLGAWACTNVGRLGTCQGYSLIGPSQSIKVEQTLRSNIPDDIALDFPGTTNTYNFTKTQRIYYDGSKTGGSEPDVPEDYFLDIARSEYCGLEIPWRENIDSIAVTETITSITRNLSSSSYSYSAYTNELNTLIGQFNISKNYEQLVRPVATGLVYFQHFIIGRRTGSVEAFCKLRKETLNGNERVILPLRSTSDSASLSKSCPIAIAPDVTKQLTFLASSATSTIAPFSFISYESIHNAKAAYFFRKNESTGTCFIGDAGEQIQTISESPTKYYLVDTFSDSERLVILPPGTQVFMYRLKPIHNRRSIFTYVPLASLDNIYTSNVQAVVNILADDTTGAYIAQPNKTKKVFKIPFDKTKSRVIQADYHA